MAECSRCECPKCQSEREDQARLAALLLSVFRLLEHDHRRQVGLVRAWDREGLSDMFARLDDQLKEIRKADSVTAPPEYTVT